MIMLYVMKLKYFVLAITIICHYEFITVFECDT